MKKLMVFAAAMLMSSVAFAAPLRGSALKQAAINMGACTVGEDGMVEFLRGGIAYVTLPGLNSNGAYENGAYNNNSYAYTSPYGGGKEDPAVQTRWYVSGAKVKVLINRAYHTVSIGFNSATCIIK